MLPQRNHKNDQKEKDHEKARKTWSNTGVPDLDLGDVLTGWRALAHGALIHGCKLAAGATQKMK